ncbi:ABC transporter permease [Lacrimispora sp.]|jgi:iron(III) transport system permease protein|uniref:ABC transporter permease n=1 Tax=Lacrimispora sp. TaxID=2719234 RepID=UPI00289A40D2|nr:iron ABC transporter permease [Lacrimispora sp.]
MKRLKDPWIYLTSLFVILSIVAIIIPMFWIFASAVMPKEGGISLINFVKFFTERTTKSAFKNSLILTAIITPVTALIGVPIAYFMARYKIRNKNLIITLITMASCAPPFLGAQAWVILLKRFGFFNWLIQLVTGIDVPFSLKGIPGIVWVNIWPLSALVFLTCYEAFIAQDPAHKEASLSLGGNKTNTLFKIELPLALPGILTGLLMAGLGAFSDFGAPYMLGGEFPVMPVIIYNEFVSEMGGNLSKAATAGIIMLFIAGAFLSLQRIILAGKAYSSISSKRYVEKTPGRLLGFAITFIIFLYVIISFMPHITLLVYSLFRFKNGKPIIDFAANGLPIIRLTLENYYNLFSHYYRPILMTFFMCGLATVLNIVVGVGIAFIIVRKRYKLFSTFLNFSVIIPYVVPGMTMAIGYIVVFNKPPIVLTGTWMILVLSYFIRKLQFSVKNAEAALYQVHPSLEEAALMVGAKPGRVFIDVTLKLMMGGVLSGSALAFTQIMTEFSTNIMLYRPPWENMVVVIFQKAMSANTDFGIASSMAVLLMIFVFVPMYLLSRMGRENVKFQEKG